MPVGFTWPLQTGEDGRIETSDDPEVLAETWINMYAQMARGRRPMRRMWGAGIDSKKFKALTRGLTDTIDTRLREMEGQIPVLIDDVTFIDMRAETGDMDKGKWQITAHLLGDVAEESVVVEVP